MFRKFYIILCLAACWWMMACTSSVRREAQETVVQVDSLWRAGEAYTDSAALAKAYETLSSSRYQLLSIFNKQLATDYAHACYHYGKLLRAKENPAAAMECFINATHSRTRDYHILGRVYSNMGDICHLANEFSLSYDMFEQSANMFLKNGDSLLFYYGINDMAFELAANGQKDSAFHLLSDIENQCYDEDVLSRHIETKAVAYMAVQQYDSAILYAQSIVANGFSDPTAYVICAQAYSHLGRKDSATFYAEKVCAISTKLSDLNNALYVLTNDDDSRDNIAIRQTSADRADIQKLLEIRQGKLSQAVLLLQQDIHRKNDWRGWVVAILIIICLAVSIIYFAARKKRKLAQEKVLLLTNQHADTMIESIKKHIDTSDLNQTLHWKEYALMKSDADLYMNGIVSKLESHKLNEVDIRFCILTLLDYPQKQIAETIHYSYPSGIKTLKKRVSEKLKTTPSELKSFLLQKM